MHSGACGAVVDAFGDHGPDASWCLRCRALTPDLRVIHLAETVDHAAEFLLGSARTLEPMWDGYGDAKPFLDVATNAFTFAAAVQLTLPGCVAVPAEIAEIADRVHDELAAVCAAVAATLTVRIRAGRLHLTGLRDDCWRRQAIWVAVDRNHLLSIDRSAPEHDERQLAFRLIAALTAPTVTPTSRSSVVAVPAVVAAAELPGVITLGTVLDEDPAPLAAVAGALVNARCAAGEVLGAARAATT